MGLLQEAEALVPATLTRMGSACRAACRGAGELRVGPAGLFPGYRVATARAVHPGHRGTGRSERRTRSRSCPPGQEALREKLREAFGLCLDALRLSIAADGLEEALVNFRKAGRKIYRAQEFLLPLCPDIPAVNRYFLEEPARSRASRIHSQSRSRSRNGPPSWRTRHRPVRAGSRLVLHPGKPGPVGTASPRHCAARGLRSREGFHLDVAPGGAKPSLRAGLPHVPQHHLDHHGSRRRRRAAEATPRVFARPVEHRPQPHPAHGALRRGAPTPSSAPSTRRRPSRTLPSSRASWRPLTWLTRKEGGFSGCMGRRTGCSRPGGRRWAKRNLPLPGPT